MVITKCPVVAQNRPLCRLMSTFGATHSEENLLP